MERDFSLRAGDELSSSCRHAGISHRPPVVELVYWQDNEYEARTGRTGGSVGEKTTRNDVAMTDNFGKDMFDRAST